MSALFTETKTISVRSDSTEAADGYVHRPTGSDAEVDTANDADVDTANDADVDTANDAEVDTANELPRNEPYTGKPSAEGFGRSGWILVAGVVLCFLVIPGFIYLNPTAPAQIGWTFFATFLVLPLIPAVLLGLLAVWSMQAAA